MTSFLNANLPSDDDEDEEFVVKGGAVAGSKRRQPKVCSGSSQSDEGEGGDDPKVASPVAVAKRARVEQAWQDLKQATSSQSGRGGLASLGSGMFKPTKSGTKSAVDSDKLWMRNLGIGSGSETNTASKPSGSLRAAAAAALAAAKDAGALTATKLAGKVTLTETRRFAGKDVEVSVTVDKGSKDAAKLAEKQKAPASGLDAFLAEVEKKKTVTVLNKSKMDWRDYKASNQVVEEELEAYKKSSDKYTDKVQFLARAELREYEADRDKRLAGDVRNRGRL